MMIIDKELVVEMYKMVVNQPYEARSAEVELIANTMQVSVPTIRAILISEKIYVPKECGKTPLLNAFEIVMGKKLNSMSNMTKKDLQELWDWFVKESSRREFSNDV